MEGFRKGDRCVPLPDGTRYGPKEWTLTVAPDGKRTWTEIAVSQADRDFARLESALAWADHPTWTRTAPITQADIDKHKLPHEYLGNSAVFPKPLPYPPGKSEEATAERRKSEDLWMAHYRDMEGLQTIIRPPDKGGSFFRSLLTLYTRRDSGERQGEAGLSVVR